MDFKVFQQKLIRFLRRELIRRKLGDHRRSLINRLFEFAQQKVFILIDQQFAGADLLKEGKQVDILCIVLHLADKEYTRAYIGVAGDDQSLLDRCRHQEVRVTGLKEIILDHRCRGYDLNDFPLGELFAGKSLFTDCDLLPGVQQPLDVIFGCMIRNPSHWDPAAGSQGDIQQARNLDRIVFKHLIEITEAKEENRVGMLLFDGTVLSHHRSIGSWFFTHINTTSS